jgi:hypothetical protein
MADNAPDKKEIQDTQEALNQYNNALKESVNLAKQLSNQVSKLPSSLNLSTSANKKLIEEVDKYKQALESTEKLARKVATGKVKQIDVEKQLQVLAQKYNDYINNSGKSFEKNNRFIAAQNTLQKKLNTLEQDRTKKQNDILDALTKMDTLQDRLKIKQQELNNAHSYQRKGIKESIKDLREQIKDQDQYTRALERGEVSIQKQIEQKTKELQQVKELIANNAALKKLYEDQIADAEALLQALKEQTTLGKLQSNNFKTFTSGIKEAVTLMAPLVAAFNAIKKFAFSISDQVTKIQKNLVLSRDEAREVRQNFNDIAVSSGDIAINTARLVEANIALGKQLGFASRFTSDLNIQFVKLTKQIGLSEEAAGGLAKLSIASGATLEESKNVALETSQALSSQYGIQLNQREVLEEVGKISGQTLAMLKASPQAIAQAVAQSKLLGTNLDLVRKQASSLLDFETSIGNELQAELLTGREINLERARSAALTGDLTTAMQELNNQNIDFNKFAQMNVIAQDKVAAALGLSSDELSDQLLKQQYLGKSVEEVAALEGEEVARRLEALSAQDKFNLAVEKMQDLVGKLIGGPLGILVDMMASLAENAYVLYGILGAMAGISFVKLVAGLAASAVQAGILAAGAITASSAITFGLAAVGIAAAIGLLMAAFSDAKSEAQETGDMFSSKGKTVVSTKEGGLFSLSDNDQFAAHPKLGEMISNTNKQTVVAQDNSELIAAVASLKEVMTGVKDSVGTLGRKEVTIKANTQVMGTAQLMGNTNLA